MAVTSLAALITRIIEFFGGLLERRRQAELASIELAGRFDAVATKPAEQFLSAVRNEQ